MADLETWKNPGNGKVWIIKSDRFGDETSEIVWPGKTFTITKEDRLLNMDRAASNSLCIFSNGTLAPVRLLDGDEDAAMFASNPNLISESDMLELFNAHWKTFAKKVEEISNPIALSRMVDLAEENGTVKQLTVLKDRLREIDPTRPAEGEVAQLGHITGRSVSGGPTDGFMPKAVTPK